MNIHELWLLSLPVAAACGWYAAMRYQNPKSGTSKKYKKLSLPPEYLAGLNFLLNDEHDKALNLFIKMLEVDSDTIETHLALGNLFRRRGEVDRATRIHQNLIARPTLEVEYRNQALLALARDYLSAGVLDRAERLFLELISLDAFVQESLKHLLDIYQQEHEWEKAIYIAERIDSGMNVAMAHHHCELAEINIQEENLNRAAKCLQQALTIDSDCARASLLYARVAAASNDHKNAINHLKNIKKQNPDFFAEAVLPLAQSYRALGKEMELVNYFRDVLKSLPKLPVAIMLSEEIRQWRGNKVAANFVADYVRKHPSVAGVHRLVELHLDMTEGKAKNDLTILQRLTQKLLDDHAPYQCINCGFAAKKIHWLCPSCRQWSMVKPTHALD
jgi:lipopolysaccharide biosynthesis regulator YciM